MKAKWLFSFMILVIVLLTGCKAEESVTPVDVNEEIVIAYVNKSSTAPFWITLLEGALDAAQSQGVKLISMGPAKENDVYGQMDVMDIIIDLDVDAIVIAPCDSELIAPYVEKASVEGIPVISVDTTVIGATVKSHISTDNYDASRTAAIWMADTLGGAGNIVMLNGMQSQSSGLERYEGFRNYIEENHPNMTIIASVDCEWRDELAADAIRNILETDSQIDGIFAAWDGAALAAHKALTEADLIDQTLICGFDAYPIALKLIGEGGFDADIAQNPYDMGYIAVETAYDTIKGNTVPAFIDTGITLITKDNLTDFIEDNNLRLP